MFQSLWKNTKKEYKVAFFGTLIIGLITHLYMITNGFPNSDSLWGFYTSQNMITSGRWFLQYACGISSYYDLPAVNGLLSLLYLAITAALLVYFFEIKNTIFIVLISGLLVTFPTIASTLSYNFTVDGYMLALLLSVAGVCLAKKYKYGYLLGAILIAFGMGIYQAYFPFILLLCLFWLIMDIAEGLGSKKWFCKVFKLLSMNLLGCALYYVILQLLLGANHVQLSTYQGINNMGKIVIGDLPMLVKRAYFDFFKFARYGKILFHNPLTGSCLILLFLVGAIAIIMAYIKKRAYLKWQNVIFLVFIIAITPLATSILYVISPYADYHVLMRMNWVLFLMIPIVWVDRYVDLESGKKVNALMGYAIVLCSFVLIFDNGLRANIAYFNLHQQYEKAYAYCLRLADRMEQTEGYYVGIPVVIAGPISEESYPSTDITQQVTDPMIGVRGSTMLNTGMHYKVFFESFLNVSVNLVDWYSTEEIRNTQIYQEMESFPGKNSIQIVDGKMYVKTD